MPEFQTIHVLRTERDTQRTHELTKCTNILL